jgi:epoxide hydrolase-like predicted phosphatase
VIKAVVFDFGGVMTTTTMPERVRPIVEEAGIGWAAIERGFEKYRRLMDADFMTLGEMYAKIWREAGVEIDAATEKKVVEADVASFMYRNEKTLEWMRELRDRGFVLGVLTNMSRSFAARARSTFADFFSLAKAMVVSGEEGIYKPMREIYDLAAARLGLEPGEICFIDDAPANCEGARAAGWKAIPFAGLDGCRRDFEALLDADGKAQ